MPDFTFSGPYIPVLAEEGSIGFSGNSNSPCAVEILSEYRLKGIGDDSKSIIDKLDLNRLEEIQYRKNAEEITKFNSASSPVELHRVINRFHSGMHEIAGLNRSTTSLNSKRNLETLHRLLYANVITTMETFLSDYLVSSVNINKEVLRNLVKNHQELNRRKLTLEDLIVTDRSPSEMVIETLKRETFHNIKTAKVYYEAAFNIDFSPSDDIIFAVNIRHDIIHRSGKKVGDEHPINISSRQTHKLILDVQTFIISLLKNLSDK